MVLLNFRAELLSCTFLLDILHLTLIAELNLKRFVHFKTERLT